jgi:hypothetical protein
LSFVLDFMVFLLHFVSRIPEGFDPFGAFCNLSRVIGDRLIISTAGYCVSIPAEAMIQ